MDRGGRWEASGLRRGTWYWALAQCWQESRYQLHFFLGCLFANPKASSSSCLVPPALCSSALADSVLLGTSGSKHPRLLNLSPPWCKSCSRIVFLEPWTKLWWNCHVAAGAGLQRCGKSCRLRWTNYLRPNIRHGSFTPDEEDLIVKLHSSLGSRFFAFFHFWYQHSGSDMSKFAAGSRLLLCIRDIPRSPLVE